MTIAHAVAGVITATPATTSRVLGCEAQPRAELGALPWTRSMTCGSDLPRDHAFLGQECDGQMMYFYVGTSSRVHYCVSRVLDYSARDWFSWAARGFPRQSSAL